MRRLVLSVRTREMVSLGSPTRPPIIVDTFFFLSAIVAFFAGAGWGVHLWLMLNGQMAMSPDYSTLRSLHALLQFQGFFGSIVLGFVLQAAPRFLKLPVNPSRLLGALPILTALGAVRLYVVPDSTWGLYLLALPPAVGLLYLAELYLLSERTISLPVLRWFAISLTAFASVPFASVDLPFRALPLFLAAVGSLLISTGQQFMFGDLKTSRFTEREDRVVWSLFLAAIFMLWLGQGGDVGLAKAGSFIFLAIILYFTARSRIVIRLFSRSPDKRSVVYGFALLWAVAGAIALAVKGIAYADVVFHLWALGWATPVMLTVGTTVLRANGGGGGVEERWWLFTLLLWQLVPLGRAGLALWPLPGWFSMIVGAIAGIVFTLWLYQTLRAFLRLTLGVAPIRRRA